MLDTIKIRSEAKKLTNDARNWHGKVLDTHLNKEEFTESMKTKYQYLFTNSSTLFNRCIEGDLNITHLNYMLGMIERVNSGADYHNTSVEVGQKLVDIYVKPMLDKKE